MSTGSDAQKQPISRNLPRMAERIALREIKNRGLSLPCTVVSVAGQIITVTFSVQSSSPIHNMSIPLASSPYIRLPVQKDDIGVAMAVDASLALLCGIGSDPANLIYDQGNLSSLYFVPLASSTLSTVDPNALVLNAPNGTVMRDTNGNTVATLTPSGWVLTAQTTISMMVSGKGISITSAGTVIDGFGFDGHYHSNSGGSGDGGPVAGG